MRSRPFGAGDLARACAGSQACRVAHSVVLSGWLGGGCRDRGVEWVKSKGGIAAVFSSVASKSNKVNVADAVIIVVRLGWAILNPNPIPHWGSPCRDSTLLIRVSALRAEWPIQPTSPTE